MGVDETAAATGSDILIEAGFEELGLTLARHPDDVEMGGACGRCDADQWRDMGPRVVTQNEVIGLGM